MSALFTPLRGGDLELANPVVIAPLWQSSTVEGCMADWRLSRLGISRSRTWRCSVPERSAELSPPSPLLTGFVQAEVRGQREQVKNAIAKPEPNRRNRNYWLLAPA